MRTDKEIANILTDMIVLVDSREKKNAHITGYFEKENIKYEVVKLETGDYSFYLPNYGGLGLDEAIMVERKNSIDEICGNFGKNRERFIREFERIENGKMHLVVENTTWTKIFNGNYRSKLSCNSLLASFITFNIRYDCPVWFVEKLHSGKIIHSILYYELREQLQTY